MAFIIPNATSTAESEKYVVIDQAEPDSLDFEILGNVGRSGVYSGCEVTLSGVNSINVAPGTIILNGVSYPVTGGPVSISAASGSKFSLVTVLVASGTAGVVVVDGADDVLNPRYPSSTATSNPPGGQINLENSVVLAAVYRTSSNLTSGSIVDKRTFLKNNVFNQGTTAPTSTSGTVGELYFSSEQATGTNSGLYIKGATGWIPIQQNVGPQVPVGAVLGWPSSAPIPSGFLAASGQVLNKTEYPALAAAYGVTASTFTLPNLNDHVLKGTTFSNLAGTSVVGSSDTRLLTEANLPSHDHGSGTHTHSMGHTHSMNHGHTGGTTGSGGAHSHTATVATSDTSRNQFLTNPLNDRNVAAGTSYTIPGSNSYGIAYALSVSNSTAPNHDHSFSVPTYSGSTGSASSSNTGPPSTSSSTAVGGDQPFDNVPKAAYVIWVIRATTGDNQPAGTSIYSSARQEVVAISYEGTLPSGSAENVTAFRLPWGATLLDVKASLDGVGITAGGTISVDVKLDGTTVLGANKLTIDSGESSSKTAATPADIAVTDLPDDSLVSIDILSANGETGPLNVVLYVIRND